MLQSPLLIQDWPVDTTVELENNNKLFPRNHDTLNCIKLDKYLAYLHNHDTCHNFSWQQIPFLPLIFLSFFLHIQFMPLLASAIPAIHISNMPFVHQLTHSYLRILSCVSPV